MNIKASSLFVSSCLLSLISGSCVSALTKTPARIPHLTKHRDVKAASRQQISYNLDLTNRNGSSALLFSKATDVVNGAFTEWSIWSACSSDCGKRSLRSRERYCTSPPPSNGGADCDGERFQLDLCKVIPCSHPVTSSPKPRHVIGRFGQWSGWSRCECKNSQQKRYRQCFSHTDAPCLGRKVETRGCKPKGCQTPFAEQSSLVDIDPKKFCGFNPCDISKCLLAPLGSCVSDYKCRPVFFDENNKRVEGCVGKRIYISPAQVSEVCKINPCEYTRCLLDFTGERCVVGTKCQAVYYSAKGQPQQCTAVLKVPAREVCGYDPCNGESCQDNANARCLVTSKCRPVFVNNFNERIRKCEEETASKNNRIQEMKEQEFEAEPDEDDETDEDNEEEDSNDQNDDDDDSYDSNQYRPKQFLDEERGNGRNGLIDDDGDDAERRNEASAEDEEDEHESGEDEDARKNLDDFKHKLSKAVGSPKVGHHETHDKANANMMENSRNFTNPLFKLLNAQNGERRSENLIQESPDLNPSSFNLQDLVSGKLNKTRGLVVGTVKKTMKIVSSKKPTTYYYFETKGKSPEENRQFMVITSPKTKKSSVHPKRFINKKDEN